jgi:hypothetical protein
VFSMYAPYHDWASTLSTKVSHGIYKDLVLGVCWSSSLSSDGAGDGDGEAVSIKLWCSIDMLRCVLYAGLLKTWEKRLC